MIEQNLPFIVGSGKWLERCDVTVELVVELRVPSSSVGMFRSAGVNRTTSDIVTKLALFTTLMPKRSVKCTLESYNLS